MKHTILMLSLVAGLLASCSSDKAEDEALEEASLVGTWNFTELNIEDAESPGEIQLANDIITLLLAQDCQLLTFTFNADGTVIAEAKDFTETGTDLNGSGTGLVLECPENTETTSSTWSLEGDQLTFIDGDGAESTVTIELEGNVLTVPAEIVDEANLKGAAAVFLRE